jgi:TolB protein
MVMALATLFLALMLGLYLPRLFPGGVIVFASESYLRHEIHLVDVNSGQLRILSPRDADGLAPAISPNGKIVFVSSTSGGNTFRLFYGLQLIYTNGGRFVPLTDSSLEAFWPRWSPDGLQIAFETGRNSIYLVDADGNNLHSFTRGASPSWSPDSRQIVYELLTIAGRDIYVISLQDGQPEPLTQNIAQDSEPMWSPVGQQIAFVSDRDGNGEIYLMSTDGSNQRNLTQERLDDRLPIWSPDGQRITFVSDRDGNREIYVMNADGSNPRRLTNANGEDSSPVWSLDGRLIAFVSNRDGNREIYVMNADGSNQRRLTWNDGDDMMPAWMP